MKKNTPLGIWKIYQKYDYLGSGEKYKYKFLIFKDNHNPYPTPGEMAIDNSRTKQNIESVSMKHISKENFIKLVHDIIKKKPKNTREWLTD